MTWIARLCAGVALISGHALAQESVSGLVAWTCWLEPVYQRAIQCREERADDATQPVDANLNPAPPDYLGDLFALGAGANVARLVHTKPEAYAGRMWSIPVHAPVIDAALVRQLALAVMCGRYTPCVIQFTGMLGER